MTGSFKHRVVHPFQKQVVNPLVKWAIARGVAPAHYALLETTGRKSGVARQTPVGNGHVGEQFWIVAEHGRRAAYVRNIEADPRVRVRYRDGGARAVWRSGTATVLPDDDPRERQRWLGETGKGRAANARAVRAFGSELLTVRVDLDPQ